MDVTSSGLPLVVPAPLAPTFGAMFLGTIVGFTYVLDVRICPPYTLIDSSETKAIRVHGSPNVPLSPAVLDRRTGAQTYCKSFNVCLISAPY